MIRRYALRNNTNKLRRLSKHLFATRVGNNFIIIIISSLNQMPGKEEKTSQFVERQATRMTTLRGPREGTKVKNTITGHD